MNDTLITRIDGFITSAIIELFTSYGLHLETTKVPEPAVVDPFASTIGFTSKSIVGALVLTASRDLAERSFPPYLKKGAMDDAIIADWTGELSNQALGRLKNRFCSAGVEIELSTPSVFTGKDLRHFVNSAQLYRRHLFWGGSALLVEFLAELDVAFELGDAADPESPTIEGEALFF